MPARDALPTWRAHNEQGMAHAAIAYAKQMRRQRAMVCTTSIGPGATNMVTAAALAHVNRLPVLLLPGDVYASRRPDPVLQQVEDFGDGTVSANDCFRPVSRYFDRITRPEQLHRRAAARRWRRCSIPANCGPATLAFCQDVQAEAFDYPGALLRAPRVAAAPPACRCARARCAGRRDTRGEASADRRRRRRALQPGRGRAGRAGRSAPACRWRKPRPARARWPGIIRSALGSIGVTGSSAANAAAAGRRPDHRHRHAPAGFHHRLAQPVRRPIASCSRSTSQAFDAHKHGAAPVVGDARAVIEALADRLARLARARRRGGAQSQRRSPSGTRRWTLRRPATRASACPATRR